MSHNIYSNIRKRAVVSSFICTDPNAEGGITFALFKRSDKVNTYQGKWAVCSGSIETTDISPEFAARREIHEETTLTDDDIFLLRKGKPFSLTDMDLNTEWTINPFAFQLKPGARPIKFDWEHTEFKFVHPQEILKMDHVPQLEVGMNRVLVSPETEVGLKILMEAKLDWLGDTQQAIIKLLTKSLQNGDLSQCVTSEDLWRDLRWKVWYFVENGPLDVGEFMRPSFTDLLSNIMKTVGASRTAEVGGAKLADLLGATNNALLNEDELWPAEGKDEDTVGEKTKESEENWNKIMADL